MGMGKSKVLIRSKSWDAQIIDILWSLVFQNPKITLRYLVQKICIKYFSLSSERVAHNSRFYVARDATILRVIITKRWNFSEWNMYNAIIFYLCSQNP